MIRVKTVNTGTSVSLRSIQSHFDETGAVGRDANRAGISLMARAAATAPRRTGNLATSHGGPHYNQTWLGGHLTITNSSRYALFVHEGTHGPIYPNNPTGYLWVRPSPHSWYRPNYEPFHDGVVVDAGGRTPRRSVAGQTGQPWMRQALEHIVHRHYHP